MEGGGEGGGLAWCGGLSEKGRIYILRGLEGIRADNANDSYSQSLVINCISRPVNSSIKTGTSESLFRT